MEKILVGVVTTPKDFKVAERFYESLRDLSPSPAKIIFAEPSGNHEYRKAVKDAGWDLLEVEAEGAASPHAAARDAILAISQRGYISGGIVGGGCLITQGIYECKHIARGRVPL